MLSVPTKDQLRVTFGLDSADASVLRYHMVYSANGPHVVGVDETMKQANEVLGGHGVEALKGNRSVYDYVPYVNMGDTYTPTILFDPDDGFIITSWGDYVEQHEDRFSEQFASPGQAIGPKARVDAAWLVDDQPNLCRTDRTVQLRNVDLWDVDAAADEVGVKLHNLRIRPNGVDVTIRPNGSGQYQKRNPLNGRRIHAVCFHGHAEFMKALYRRVPNMVIRTAMETYRNADDFESKYRAVAYRNIGSQMWPADFGDACDC